MSSSSAAATLVDERLDADEDESTMKTIEGGWVELLGRGETGK